MTSLIFLTDFLFDNGEDISPQFSISCLISEIKTIAIIMDDLDIACMITAYAYRVCIHFQAKMWEGNPTSPCDLYIIIHVRNVFGCAPMEPAMLFTLPLP